MKRKMQRFVTVSTAAALSLAMAVPGSAAYQPEQKFQDVSRSASYYEDVMDANYYGLMAGVSGKTFDTESTITRAMWVTMLYKMAGQPAVQSKDTFTDVKTGDWFAQAATWAVEQGITAGYEDGSFGVNQTITRQEMAVMASKFAAQYKDAAGWPGSPCSWGTACRPPPASHRWTVPRTWPRWPSCPAPRHRRNRPGSQRR